MKFRLFAAVAILAAAALPAQAKELMPEVTAQRYCMLRDAGVNHNRAWQRATEYGTSKVYRGGDKVISVRAGSAGREDVWLTHHRIKQLCGDQANKGQTIPRTRFNTPPQRPVPVRVVPSEQQLKAQRLAVIAQQRQACSQMVSSAPRAERLKVMMSGC